MARAEGDDGTLVSSRARRCGPRAERGDLEFRAHVSPTRLHANSCFVDIQAGAGWHRGAGLAQMLERNVREVRRSAGGFASEILEQSEGEVAGNQDRDP